MKYLRDWKDHIRGNAVDLIFIGLITVALLLATGGIKSGFDKRYSMTGHGGARKVDLVKVKKQISDGELSSRKALFYRKTPE